METNRTKTRKTSSNEVSAVVEGNRPRTRQQTTLEQQQQQQQPAIEQRNKRKGTSDKRLVCVCNVRVEPRKQQRKKRKMNESDEARRRRPTEGESRASGTGKCTSQDESETEIVAPGDSISFDNLSQMFRGESRGDSRLAGRFREILSLLKQRQDQMLKIVALQELAEMLSIMTEDLIMSQGGPRSIGLDPEQFVLALIETIKGDGESSEFADIPPELLAEMGIVAQQAANPEVLLLGCRCLLNLIEALPTCILFVIQNHGIDVLVAKLTSIDYIDLAEQVLSVLERISQEYPSAVVRANGINAALQYIDFFSLHVQRSALSLVANACRGLGTVNRMIASNDRQLTDQDISKMLQESMPILHRLLSYDDSRMVETAVTCVARIIDWSIKSNQMHVLVNADLLQSLVDLIVADSKAVQPATFTQIITSLGLVIRKSQDFSLLLLKELRFASALVRILTTPDTDNVAGLSRTFLSSIAVNTVVTRPRDQMLEILSVCSQFFPRMPSNGAEASDEVSIEEQDEEELKRQKSMHENLESYQELVRLLIPVVIAIFDATVNVKIRLRVARFLVRAAWFMPDVFCETYSNASPSKLLSDLLAYNQQIFFHSTHGHQHQSKNRLDFVTLMHAGVLIIKILSKYKETEFMKKLIREGALIDLHKIQEGCSKTIGPCDTSILAANDSNEEEEEEDEENEEETTRDAGLVTLQDILAHSGRLAEAFDGQTGMLAIDERANERLQGIIRRLATTINADQSSASNQAVELVTGVKTSEQEAIKWCEDACSLLLNDSESILVSATSFDELLAKLKEHCQALKAASTEGNLSNAENALNDIARVLSSEKDSITGYEIVESDLMSSLVAFLTKGDTDDDIIKRHDLFRKVFLSVHGTSLSVLVGKLGELLSKTEHFEVISGVPHRAARSSLFTSFFGATSSSHEQDPLLQLTKQLRIKLVPKDEESVAGGHGGFVISIHAIATFKTLDEFVRSRVAFASSSSEEMNVASVRASDTDLVELDISEEDDDEDDVSNEEEDFYDDEMSVGQMLMAADEARRQERLNQDTEPIVAPPRTRQSPQQNTFSYARAVQGSYRIKFTLNGVPIPRDRTLFGAIYSQHKDDLSSLWSTTHQIVYERTEETSSRTSLSLEQAVPQNQDLLELIRDQKSGDDSIQVMETLRILYLVIQNATDQGLDQQSFVNVKLTSKLIRQLDEPLIVASRVLPDWCNLLCTRYPFLVSFETRLVYLQSTSFGYSRSISRWQNQNPGTTNDASVSVVGRIRRQKYRITRTGILASMQKIVASSIQTSAIQSFAEIEFIGEVGSGLGPTLEFFSLVCKELRKAVGATLTSKTPLILWRNPSSTNSSVYINAPNGLFPAPLKANKHQKHQVYFHTVAYPLCRSTIELFRSMGSFVAKALIDGRNLDIPLSSVFIDLAMGRVDVSLLDTDHKILLIKLIDKQLSSSLKSLLSMEASQIESLGLDFTLPGYPHVKLVKGGNKVNVTHSNLSEYINLVLDQTLGSGVAEQIKAFKSGFDLVFPIADLAIFSSEERVLLLGGAADEDWSIDTIIQNLKADHGFSTSSRVVLDLVKYMASLDIQKRRKFVQFLTGSPRLPLGGFKALQPQLTVVCRSVTKNESPNDYLPSVMTCVNYLKVPEYTSYQVLADRFDIAIAEGQGSFHLS